jgi:hypothetical protein
MYPQRGYVYPKPDGVDTRAIHRAARIKAGFLAGGLRALARPKPGGRLNPGEPSLGDGGRSPGPARSAARLVGALSDALESRAPRF